MVLEPEHCPDPTLGGTHGPRGNTDPGQAQTWDSQGSRTHTHGSRTHTQGSSTHAHLGSCFVVYCTRSRAGQAGLCGPGWFPAWSRCRVPSPQAPGHTDMPGLLSAHTGRGRSDVQVILPSPQPGWQQREHRSVGRTQDLSEGRQGPGSAQSPRGCCGAPAPSRNHIT